jgi:hypothetical protein
MKWWILGLLVGLALWWRIGCTTIMHPDRLQTVAINSTPPGAHIRVNGSTQGTTPAQVTLDRRQAYTVQLSKAGCQGYQQALAKSTDPLFFVNALFLPGFVVDLATGAWQAFPEQVEGHLQCSLAQR